MNTRELIAVHERNTRHAGVNALFSKAHSMDWDLDRDVDWSLEVGRDDPCIDPSWSTFGRTPTFRALPPEVQARTARLQLADTLNLLQVGESVAQDVCAKLALVCPEEDYRNHAVAQAMDEARHHMAYVRFLEKMGADDAEGPDPMTEALFDSLLGSDDPTTLIATEQFFLESLAMRLFERMAEQATHPLLRDIVTLIKRDEARHMGFGVLYVAEHMKGLDVAGRFAFAREWLPRIIAILDRPLGRIAALRATVRLRRAGVDDPEGLAQRMLEEQGALSQEDRIEATSGRRVSHMLTSCRRAGLLAPDILETLGLEEHPLIRGALRAPPPSG